MIMTVNEFDVNNIHPTMNSPTIQLILNINRLIHEDNPMWQYHINHLILTERYAHTINALLGNPCHQIDLTIAAVSHDTFKERSLDVTKKISYGAIDIPQDTTAYVRSNMNVLEEFGLDDYFNTSVQYHALAAGIWLYKEFITKQPSILYPIFFHACPIIEVYQYLPYDIQVAIDIMMLADKLSSNYLKINLLEKPVRCDLDQIVFGNSGCEFNYSLGLAVARMIGVGKSTEYYGLESVQHYLDRARAINPFLPKTFSLKRLGGNKKWPKRSSRRLMMG